MKIPEDVALYRALCSTDWTLISTVLDRLTQEQTCIQFAGDGRLREESGLLEASLELPLLMISQLVFDH